MGRAAMRFHTAYGVESSGVYCDTSYAYEQGLFIEIPDILEQVRRLRCDLVEVTGGEPLMQEETPSLIRQAAR